MKSAASFRSRRILRWGLVSLLLLICLSMLIGGGLWYYLFGRVGTPVSEFEVKAQQAKIDKQWQQCEAWFERMNVTLRFTRDLRGTLLKQEKIGDRLEPMAAIQVKIRKRPLSIYLCWVEPTPGREVIYEAKERGNKVLAHEGAPLRAVSPDVLMPLDHPLALQFSRHPVNELSLQYIMRQMPVYLADAKANPDLEIAIDRNRILREKPCVHIRFRHPAGSAGPTDYCRFDIYLDRQRKMPLRWERYAFAEDGSEELIEYFEITDFERNVGLQDEDFDPQNKAYQFNPNWIMEL